MIKSEQINELAAALSKAQGEMGAAERDATNPFFRSGYATLASVITTSKQPLKNHGLSITQTTFYNEHGLMLETTLMHSSGQWISSLYPVNPVKNDPQGLGSALSYSKRYALQAMLCIPSDDDDAEAAMNINGEQKPKAQTVAKKEVAAPKGNEHCGKPMRRSNFPENLPPEKRPWYCGECKAQFVAS